MSLYGASLKIIHFLSVSSILELLQYSYRKGNKNIEKKGRGETQIKEKVSNRNN